MTDFYNITFQDNRINIHGLPKETVKIVALELEKSVKELSGLTSHLTDLEYSRKCLESINKHREDHFIRDVLWKSAITYFIKCFGRNGARKSLDYKQVLKGQEEGKEVYRYFLYLRNKYIVHHDSLYQQCLIGAAINNGEKKIKLKKLCV